MRTNLLSNSFSLLFNTNLIKAISPFFFLLIGAPALISEFMPSLSIFKYLGGLFLFTILMSFLRNYENEEPIIFPEIKIILKKSWKIFVANLISYIIILIGFICLIVPGIILTKRYLYVGIICEKEMTGPLDSMRKSAELSKNNGWDVLLIGIIFGIICLPIILISFMYEGRVFLGFIFDLPELWIGFIGYDLFLFTAYKQALNSKRPSYFK